MSGAIMGFVKRELRKIIGNFLLSFDDATDEDLEEIWSYIRFLADCELNKIDRERKSKSL